MGPSQTCVCISERDEETSTLTDQGSFVHSSCVPTPLHHMQLTAEKALKERRAAEEAEAARRAEDDRVDMEWAAARVSEVQERQTSSADGALSRCETEFGVAWACDPPVCGQELLSATWHSQQVVFLGR